MQKANHNIQNTQNFKSKSDLLKFGLKKYEVENFFTKKSER